MMAVTTPVEKCVHVPAALEQWAAEHNDQLSDATLEEVRRIAETIAGSALGTVPIDQIDSDDVGEHLAEVFPGARAERAATLIQVVRDWCARQAPPDVVDAPPDPSAAAPTAVTPTQAAPSPVAPTAVTPSPVAPSPVAPTAVTPSPVAPSTPAVDSMPVPVAATSTVAKDPGPTFVAATQVLPQADKADDRVAAPAFLRSDKVDEEDDVRLYGPKRRWKAILGAVAALAVLAAAGFGGWYWFNQRDDASPTTTTATDVDPAPTLAPDSADDADVPTAVATVLPTAEPEPTPDLPSFWADTTPILNSGTAPIVASTYSVSPANRAVLTGHTAAITGVVISNDGRVLTSGADRRLVDWGADVTLANPDVLNVPSPLTVLERTVDQRIIAGDADGTVTIIDLVNTAEPIVINAHDVAISAATELIDGRLAVASADGDVAVFAIDTPDERISLPHRVEVTAVAGLDDGTIVTAAVDGIVRLWAPDGSGEPGEIATLGAPVTALALLADGRLATASVDGSIHVVPAVADPTEVVVLPGHIGAVRALYEIVMPDGSMALASGGDDTTIRVWDVETRTQLLVLEGHGDIISGLDSLPDGRLVSTSGDGTGRVWDLTLPPSREVIPPHDWNVSAIHRWNNDQFITGGTDGKIMLNSTSETSEPTLITRHDAPIVGVATLQSGDIVSLDANSVLRINQSDGDPAGLVEIMVAPGATALDVRDGEGIVTGHADGTVRFHDFSDEVLSVDAHGSGVNDVVSLSNGLVASAGQDKTVRIIDPANPDQVPVFDLHTAAVDVVIELPDGRIASAGSDGIYVFSIEGLAQDHIRLNGQRSRTISLVALPDGGLISTGDDGRVRLWDLNTPDAEPITLIDIPGIVNPYLIKADNGLYVSGAARGYVVFGLS